MRILQRAGQNDSDVAIGQDSRDTGDVVSVEVGQHHRGNGDNAGVVDARAHPIRIVAGVDDHRLLITGAQQQ